MKRTMVATWAVLMVAVIVMAGCTRSGDTSPDAKAFLTELYGHYNGATHDFSPLLDKAPAYFDSSLIALMQENERVTPQGDVGAMDFDPVCACQDYGKLSAGIHVLAATTTTAKVAAVLHDDGVSPGADVSLSYDLVKVAGGWRIHDIGTTDVPSLRQWLIKANKLPAI